jgi:UDP-hydrolysing UDP-N-acetyl-D-glucosamine 2-epimerase
MRPILADLKRIAILTTGRQDYGILRSTIRLLRERSAPECLVWAGGMHLSPRFGNTVQHIENDGVAVTRRLPFVAEPPSPPDDSAGALVAVARALAEDRPDALMLLGDRSETLAAAMAATLARVPIVHLHGGEETEGAVDNAFRHAITKLSHLHLVSHEEHAARVRQMGEDPASVVVVGAPGLDNLRRTDLPSRDAVARDLKARLDDPLVLVTVHPATLGGEPLAEVTAVAEAMEAVEACYVVTAPNADAGGAEIRAFWESRAGRWKGNVVFVDSLGEARYWALLRSACAVLGNSSGFVIEAPAAGVPVVNVGDRQKGRLRSGFVRDVPADAGAITAALREVMGHRRDDPAHGQAASSAERIAAALDAWRVPKPPRKTFHALERA